MRSLFKKIFFILFAFVIFTQSVFAQNNPVNAYFFYGDSCPHCGKESEYLSNVLIIDYPNLQIYEYEIYKNSENIILLQKIAEKLGLKVDGVPFLIIGDQHFVGYADGISPEMIEERVKECSMEICPDSVFSIVTPEVFVTEIPAPVINSDDTIISNNEQAIVTDIESEDQNTQIATVADEKIIKLPILGEIDALKFSLPILTIIMGVLDGFNPCAMWVLLFLISLLLGIENKKRMWLLGSAFIVASASVYFLFMSAWLNLILFLGFVIWIRTLIGAIALFGGAYSVKEFIFNKDSGCKVAGDGKRQKTFNKLKLIVQQNSLWLALGGIILLAFAVNLVELVCSAGLPAVYTQVLALNEMPNWQYYFYILIYILFFMLDDLFIFFVAMITLEMTGITTKYARISRLIGGLVMLAIGFMLILKPEWLMFG